MKSDDNDNFIGGYLFSAIAIVGGFACALVGQGGFRSAYTSGMHIRIGGALLFISGVVMLTSTMRMRRKQRRDREQGQSDKNGLE